MALFIGLIIFVVWLARLSFSQDYDNYDVLFVGPVRGLSQGGEVHFNGIKVGEVTKIALDKEDPNRVIAQVRVTSDVPIRTDSFASLEPQGITGVNYIQITAGTPSLKLLKETVPDGQRPVIRSQRSALADLLEGGGTVLSRTIEALDRVNRVLSNDNIKSFTGTMNNLNEFTEEAKKRKDVIADAQTTLKSINQTALDISAFAKSGQKTMDTDVGTSLKKIDDAADQVNKAAADLSGVLTKLDGPVNEFATTGLPELTDAIGSLQDAANSLGRLANDAQQNPQGLVGKPPATKKEVKP